MEWSFILLWVLSPMLLAAGSVAAALVVAAGIRRIRARGAGAGLDPPAPAALAQTKGVNNQEIKVVYCARSEGGPVLPDRSVCPAERPKCGRGASGVAFIAAGGRGRIVRQLCLTMTPITNIAAGILIADHRYAELPLPLLASAALAFLVVTLEDRERAPGATPVTDNRDAETPHPLLARKTC
jgi:hypothetical protein